MTKGVYKEETYAIFRVPAGSVAVEGVFKNFNTIEEFRDVEAKRQLFNEVADSVSTPYRSTDCHD